MSSRSNTRSTAPLAASMLLAVLSGCTTGGPVLTGSSSTLGSGSSTPTPTPVPVSTPTPTATPVSTPIPGTGTNPITVGEGQFSLDGGYIAVFPAFTLSAGGSVDFVADWVSPLNDIDIGITTGECTVTLLQLSACSFAAVADSATAKPEEIVLPIAAGTYTPVIGNFTVATEVITYRLVYTPAAALSAAERSAWAVRLTAEAASGRTVLRIPGRLKR